MGNSKSFLMKVCDAAIADGREHYNSDKMYKIAMDTIWQRQDFSALREMEMANDKWLSSATYRFKRARAKAQSRQLPAGIAAGVGISVLCYWFSSMIAHYTDFLSLTSLFSALAILASYAVVSVTFSAVRTAGYEYGVFMERQLDIKNAMETMINETEQAYAVVQRTIEVVDERGTQFAEAFCAIRYAVYEQNVVQ